LNLLARTRSAGLIAAGALATAALLAPASVAAAGPQHANGGSGDGLPCTLSSFQWDVPNGRNDWAMTTVHVQAKGALANGCSFSFSLNAYSAQGATWPTSGVQALLAHKSITLTTASPSGTLTVAKPECFGQTDFYTGTTAYDGVDGALPKYPGTATPYGLISYSNGGQACQQPSESPSTPVQSEQPSSSPSETPSTPPSETPSTPPSEDPSESPSTPASEQPSESPSQPVQSESPSTPASEQPSESPSASPSESPSTSPSTEPSTSPSSDPSSSPSSKPSGSVLGETGVPHITPPPTDTTTATSSSNSGTGWQLILLAIAGMVAALVTLTPAGARKRR
jgi:hypothetical protein